MGTTEIFIGLAGLIVAILAFKYDHFSKPLEELEHLKVQFKSTQKVALEIREDIDYLINKYDIGDCDFFPGFTYSLYLESLNSALSDCLSNDLIDKIESLEPSKVAIDSMQKSLETQFNALLQVKGYLQIQKKQIEYNM